MFTDLMMLSGVMLAVAVVIGFAMGFALGEFEQKRKGKSGGLR